MAEIVNLRMARKAKRRADASGAADQARALAGETRAQKALRKAESDRAARNLDGARREP